MYDGSQTSPDIFPDVPGETESGGRFHPMHQEILLLANLMCMVDLRPVSDK